MGYNMAYNKMKGFVKCQNGHYYKEGLSSCPYCNKEKDIDNCTTTVPEADSNFGEVKKGNETVFIRNNQSIGTHEPKQSVVINKPSKKQDKTVFGEEIEEETETGSIVTKVEYRGNRRLVGWLVTYSFDNLGVDYRLYEGRNIIGRDPDCNITIAEDMTVTGKHATLLFKNGKYKIKDELSTHGTIVNDVDIEEEIKEIFDGDIIKLGETVLKFKSSL